MKKLTKITSLLLSIVMLMSTFVGCGMFYDDTPEEVFDPPYLENYYLNKHEPVMKAGGIDIYKYENAKSYGLLMGGHLYFGGVVLRHFAGPLEYFDVEFPLEGQYDYFSFVLGGDSEWIMPDYYTGEFSYDPTLVGIARELKVALQVLIDGELVEEFVVSCYDVVKRFTYDVKGAQNIEVKAVTGDDGFSITMAEITVWNGEPHETGYVPAPAGSEPVQLIKDLKPYVTKKIPLP